MGKDLVDRWCVVCATAHLKRTTGADRGGRRVRQKGQSGSYWAGVVDSGPEFHDGAVHLPPDAHKDDVGDDIVGWTCKRYQEPSISTKHDDRLRRPNVGAGLIALQRDGGGMSRSQLAAVADAASEVTNAVLVRLDFCHLLFVVFQDDHVLSTCFLSKRH
jgi:hypothetical protein